MKYSFYGNISINYAKAMARLEKGLFNGRFASYSQRRKRQIWNRLCRYARQLGIQVRASIATACVAAGLCLVTPAQAQTSFIEQTGAANPLNGINVGNVSKPAFADIDGDGDLDAFIGTVSPGTTRYYKNTGSSVSPFFVEQTGASNPLSGSPYGSAVCSFGDIDGDGDLDIFMGTLVSNVIYFKNTGTSTAPVFTEQSGAANPLNMLTNLAYCSPALVDIDGDGDLDVFIGEDYGNIYYYKNTGTASSPVFTQQTGAANPFDGLNVGNDTAPCFMDVDGNGTMDAFIGAFPGVIYYYKNTGTAASPVFTQQTGNNNPLNGVNVILFSDPAAADINGDGKQDVFIGGWNGTVSCYLNSNITLPLKLISFLGDRRQGFNQLEWKTAEEMNTLKFELESSSSGSGFTTLATISAMGNGNNNYSFRDTRMYSGKMYYRLKMTDIDGRFTYSQVIWISIGETADVTIYPNPAGDRINVNLGNQRMINTTAFLYSANGNLLQRILITGRQQQINLQSLAKGVYLLKFADGSLSTFIKD